MTEDYRTVREQQVWNQYSNALAKQGIKPDFVRWHVLHAQAFIQAFPDGRPADFGPGHRWILHEDAP